MLYLYHAVPRFLTGTALYPLNELKNIYPEVYAKEFSKYTGREEVTQQKIPGLDCLWNDVLHFTVVHPSAIKSALLEAGDPAPFNRAYYEIDPAALDPKNAIVFLYRYRDWDREDNWAAYDPNDLETYSTIPHATKEYYKAKFQKNERPLLFHGVTHILYKGSLDVSSTRILSSY